MPSNFTENYELSQWEKSDKVLMEDFNADNAKIDAALTALAAKDTSLNAALAARGNCRVETFSYTGDGVNGTAKNDSRVITFSARPAFFIIVGEHTLVFGNGSSSLAHTAHNVDGRSGNSHITVSWSGYKATLSGDGRAVPNNLNCVYLVAAFYAEDAS